MEKGELIALIGVVGTVCSIVFGYIGYQKGIKKDSKDEGRAVGSLKSDTEYIKRRIDDILLEQKDTNKSITLLAERVARVEESTKSAHHRIDAIAKG